MDNSTKLIERIKEERVRPIPRWRFTLKDSLVWLSFIACILFGALAFSVILFAIQQADFNLLGHLSHSFFEMLLALMPVAWIIFLVIFLVSAIFSIKNSKKGYKFAPPSLVGFATGLSILLGTLFFISGGADWLENAFASRINVYEGIEERKARVWSEPENGFLSGTIISAGDSLFELKDLKGKAWQVSFQGADVVPAVHIADGEKIKMTGTMTSENTFKAEMIRPWGGFQHRYQGGRNRN
jgi:heme/copper-type cytochrome/quinol oxidase subunit 2